LCSGVNSDNFIADSGGLYCCDLNTVNCIALCCAVNGDSRTSVRIFVFFYLDTVNFIALWPAVIIESGTIAWINLTLLTG